MQSAACRATFDTAELFDEIVLYLPAQANMICAPRVSESWYTAIRASSAIRRKLRLGPRATEVTSPGGLSGSHSIDWIYHHHPYIYKALVSGVPICLPDQLALPGLAGATIPSPHSRYYHTACRDGLCVEEAAGVGTTATRGRQGAQSHLETFQTRKKLFYSSSNHPSKSKLASTSRPACKRESTKFPGNVLRTMVECLRLGLQVWLIAGGDMLVSETGGFPHHEMKWCSIDSARWLGVACHISLQRVALAGYHSQKFAGQRAIETYSTFTPYQLLQFSSFQTSIPHNEDTLGGLWKFKWIHGYLVVAGLIDLDRPMSN